MKAPSVKTVRCAIYTRVSTEHGLDQEFKCESFEVRFPDGETRPSLTCNFEAIVLRESGTRIPIGKLF